MSCHAHPWALTAPWWRWPKLGAPSRDVRGLPPALQMYDSSDPVTGFLKDPQRALAFGGEDVVKTLSAAVAAPGRLPRLSARTLSSTTTRKVFLPIHKRFYLVVCELHCDTAGFPTVGRDQVCEAGMVIRRRKLAVADEHAPQAIGILNTIGAATAKLAAVERSVEKRVLKKRHRMAGVGASGPAASAKSPIDAALGRAAGAERARLEGELAVARAQLRDWQVASGATVLTEGWIASDYENVGAWQVVADDPQGVAEVVYPLYPLVPDPRNPAHDGAGKAIWFGMLPTGSREVEVTGAARFDDESRYEVRCFVRRHECDCPKTGQPNDCGGELVWSAASEVFQLAPHFDPAGTGNHPVTIQMPDIPTLAASAPSLPVAMKFPAGSALGFKVDAENLKISAPTTNKLPQICYFSIPLITIVATFVLHIFLPIVVLVFQLWFLLGLKFCILPSLKLQVGLDGQVSADIQAQLDMSVSLDAAIDVAAGVNLDEALVANLNLNIGGDAFATVNAATHDVTLLPTAVGSPGAVMRDTYATSVLQQLSDDLTTDRKQEVDGRSIVAGLLFIERVERAEVGA